MSDTDRVIGALQEFKLAAERRFDALETKVDSLRLWRASIIGMASIAGAAFGFIASWLKG